MSANKRTTKDFRGIRERRAVRIAEAYKHRLDGLTYREIATAMRLDVKTVHTLVADGYAEIDALGAERREQCRQLERDRLDRLLVAFQPLADKGDAQAAGVVLRAQERRAKLDGLDAPAQLEHTVQGGVQLL